MGKSELLVSGLAVAAIRAGTSDSFQPDASRPRRQAVAHLGPARPARRSWPASSTSSSPAGRPGASDQTGREEPELEERVRESRASPHRGDVKTEPQRGDV